MLFGVVSTYQSSKYLILKTLGKVLGLFFFFLELDVSYNSTIKSAGRLC